MAEYTCENINRNFVARPFLVAEDPPPGPKPTEDDLRLVTQWFRDMPQADLDQPLEVDPTASVLVFVARAKGELKEADIGVILSAQRQVMAEQFSRVIVRCSGERMRST